MSTPPPTFENYPPAADAGAGSRDGADPIEPPRSEPRPVVFAPPSAPPPPPAGTDRRHVLRWIGVGAAALFAVPVIASVRNGSEPGPDEGWASETAAPEEDPTDNQADIGDYTVTWPDGWTVDGTTDTQVVLVQGDATVIFRAYTAGDDATAAEEAQRLLNRHTAGLGKRKTGAAKKRTGPVETATIEGSGVRGDGVRIDATVDVAIESEERAALAVIALLPSDLSAARRKEVDRMRRDFLEQLG